MTVSCNQQKADGTYLGGEIVNPLSNAVVLRKGNTPITEIPLNQNNQFMFKFKDFEPGLYTFFHKERQLVFIEKNDSILLRLNTFQFDETLTFSGLGAIKNNLLIKFFLMYESEGKAMLDHQVYQRDYDGFEKYVDSLQQQHEEIWTHAQLTNEFSTAFEDLMDVDIRYEDYAMKEAYCLSSFGQSSVKDIKNTPADFHNYRKDIDLDMSQYLSLYSYQRFLYNYFNHLAYEEYADDMVYDPKSFTHNAHKLRLIKEKIENDSVQSYLLTRPIRDYLSDSNDKTGGKLLYEIYMERISSPYDKKEIQDLYAANKNVEAGRFLPEETLYDIKGNEVKLKSLIKKPTIIFFWTENRKSHIMTAHEKIREIRRKYPQYDYLAINIDKDEDEWLKLVELYKLDPKKEFRFKDELEQLKQDLAITNVIRTFIVDGDGTIFNGHANMFSSNFEKELQKYLKR